MRKLGQFRVDRVFDEGLRDAEMPVSGKVWDAIATQLEKDHLRRQVLWYRGIAAASIALLMGLGAWMLVVQGISGGPVRMALGKQVSTTVNLPSFAQGTCRGLGSWASPKQQMASTTASLEAADALPRLAVETSPSVEAVPATVPNLGQTLASGRDGITRIRQTIRAQQPNLMPSLQGTGKRGRPVALVPPGGKIGELFASKALKKEKEFTYELEETAAKAPRPRKRWEVGAAFSPDMTFASTVPIQQNARSPQVLADDPTKANVNKLSPVMAYAGMVNTTFTVNDRWSMRAGLSCINRQSSTVAPVNTYGKNTTSYQSNLNLYTLEVPVSVRYNVIHADKFDYYVSSGVSGNFFLHYDNYLQSADGKIAGRRSSSTSDVLKPSQANLLLSTGLRYNLLERLSMQLEPGVRYGFYTNEYAFSQSRPLSMSLLSGLSYRF